MLPFPKATEEQVGEGFTLFDPKMAYGVISKATPSYKHELAKEFLQFCYTDENLAAFSVATNSFRDLDYTLTTEQVAQLSGFGRSLYELKASGQLTIAYALSDSVKFLDNQTAISNMMAKVYWNKASCYATEQLLNGVSAIDLFNTSKSYRQSMWSSLN